jgi:hypothetical protein
MAYAKGRTYIPRREREVKQFLKKKDIEGLLWLILEDSYGYGEEPVPPKELKTFAIQQLTLMQSRKKGVTQDGGGDDALMKWLGLSEDEDDVTFGDNGLLPGSEGDDGDA